MKPKKHILIVDDVTTNLRCIGEILKDTYSLSMAKSGEQALQMLGKIKPDLCLLDVKMPGIDGYETLSKIRAIPSLKDMPVVFLTADNKEEGMLKGLSLGAVDFIKKPLQPDEMKERIAKAIEQSDRQQITNNEE